MAVDKTYPNADISSTEALEQSLIKEGVYDAEFTLNGDLWISSDTATEAQCDNAVAAAAPGTFTSNKSDKILAVRAKSFELLANGVETWVPGAYSMLSQNTATVHYTAFQYFDAHPAKLTENTPYMVYTNDGRAVSTHTLSDIKSFVDDAEDRLTYIYTASYNADGSSGEIKIIKDIVDAVDQPALDAIIDTRS